MNNQDSCCPSCHPIIKMILTLVSKLRDKETHLPSSPRLKPEAFERQSTLKGLISWLGHLCVPCASFCPLYMLVLSLLVH